MGPLCSARWLLADLRLPADRTLNIASPPVEAVWKAGPSSDQWLVGDYHGHLADSISSMGLNFTEIRRDGESPEEKRGPFAGASKGRWEYLVFVVFIRLSKDTNLKTDYCNCSMQNMHAKTQRWSTGRCWTSGFSCQQHICAIRAE